jgi:hypothetical protein
LLIASIGLRAEEIKAVAADSPQPRPLVQMAILLDTSSSMDGLIDQARTQLWRVVNEFITATRDGKKPELQVALYEYGKPTLGQESGYIRQVVPLTTDLDKVSQELFGLKTNGGDEYCGWVIRTAVEQLSWSKSNKDLKVIFIAGNEPFTQGPVDYRDSCKKAIANGIIVNTIHCGPWQQGINEKWQDGALLADGKYSCIEQDKTVVHIDAPQDKELGKLNDDLNKTYMAFGANGKDAQQNQAAQDANALKSGSFGERAACKASGNYRAEGWDLVDAYKNAKKKIEEVKEEELPEEMKKLTVEQRKDLLEAKYKERADIQKKILELRDARTKYVADEMKKKADTKDDSLDKVMSKAVREQAEKKDFTFK